LKPTVPTSPKAIEWTRELKRNGIVKIEGPEFIKMADEINQNYFSRIDLENKRELNESEIGKKGTFLIENKKSIYASWGTEFTGYVSFRDPSLYSVHLNSDLIGVMYNYYNRQPYFRNNSVLEKVDFKKGQNAEAGAKYHVDHLHQLSIMMLLSDITEKDTHMEYVIGNHKRSLRKGIYLSFDEAEKTGKKGPIYRLTGKKGTLFLFDAHGVHRRFLQEGATRKIFHSVITTGHNITGTYFDKKRNWPELENAPEHVRRAFDYLPE
jgi:hypothetical protein